MKKYLITYDLKDTAWNHAPFFTALQNIGPWWHYLQSTWIVKTNMSAVQIHANLGPFLSKNDHILIVEINSQDKWGWLPQDAWQWIDS